MQVEWTLTGITVRHTVEETDDHTAYEPVEMSGAEFIYHAANMHKMRAATDRELLTLWSLPAQVAAVTSVSRSDNV